MTQPTPLLPTLQGMEPGAMHANAPGVGSSAPSPERRAIEILQSVLRQYRDRIVTVLARMTRDFQLAEELAQDVFITFHRECLRIPETATAAWLYKAAHHRAIDEARRRRRRPSPLWLEDLELEPRALAEPLDGSKLTRVLEHAIGELPAKFRDVFLLCEIESFSQEQAAAILRCPKKTVSTRLFRARQRLLKHVAHRMEKEGLSSPDCRRGAP
jgi:RNA polymerase sigma-70 factor (ECF subfamily)